MLAAGSMFFQKVKLDRNFLKRRGCAQSRKRWETEQSDLRAGRSRIWRIIDMISNDSDPIVVVSSSPTTTFLVQKDMAMKLQKCF